MDAAARARRIGFDHYQAAVDLRAPVHPRGILLADEATLGEADAVQFGRVAFEPEQVAELGPPFAHSKAQPMLEPAGGRPFGKSEPATTELRQPRVGNAFAAVLRPVDRQFVVAFDADRAA